MKLEKITRRRYDDACGAAHALELVGERWALLVIRELMLGPRRFGALRGDLAGISANVLTQRLEGLIAAGIVRRRRLPPPASAPVYELTAWGLESEPIFQALGRWAARSPAHDPTLPFSAVSLMLSLRTMIAPANAPAMTVGFRLGEDAFVARLDPHGIRIRREEPAAPDVLLQGTAETIASVVYGGRPMADAEAAGALAVGGNRALAERFVTLFPLPPKVAVE